MLLFDLFTPWLIFAGMLYLLLHLSRWIHRHLYGVGWLLTQDNESATILYYLLLLPGVFLHEVSQWLVAGALNVPTRRVIKWPKAQKQGELHLDFVRIGKTDRFRGAILGAVPLIVGVVLILLIANNVLNLTVLSIAIGTGELAIIGEALRRLFATPDFWLWIYLLFAIGNTMLPNPADRQGWNLLLAIFGVIALALLILGFGDEILVPTMQGPLAQILNTLATALGTILVLDLMMGLFVGLLEQLLEQIKHAKAPYPGKKRVAPIKLQPGGPVALPVDQAPVRITERPLPLPGPPRRQKRPPTPVVSSPPPRPALASTTASSTTTSRTENPYLSRRTAQEEQGSEASVDSYYNRYLRPVQPVTSSTVEVEEEESGDGLEYVDETLDNDTSQEREEASEADSDEADTVADEDDDLDDELSYDPLDDYGYDYDPRDDGV